MSYRVSHPHLTYHSVGLVLEGVSQTKRTATSCSGPVEITPVSDLRTVPKTLVCGAQALCPVVRHHKSRSNTKLVVEGFWPLPFSRWVFSL